jgi:hypothetical protein
LTWQRIVSFNVCNFHNKREGVSSFLPLPDNSVYNIKVFTVKASLTFLESIGDRAARAEYPIRCRRRIEKPAECRRSPAGDHPRPDFGIDK